MFGVSRPWYVRPEGHRVGPAALLVAVGAPLPVDLVHHHVPRGPGTGPCRSSSGAGTRHRRSRPRWGGVPVRLRQAVVVLPPLAVAVCTSPGTCTRTTRSPCPSSGRSASSWPASARRHDRFDGLHAQPSAERHPPSDHRSRRSVWCAAGRAARLLGPGQRDDAGVGHARHAHLPGRLYRRRLRGAAIVPVRRASVAGTFRPAQRGNAGAPAGGAGRASRLRRPAARHVRGRQHGHIPVVQLARLERLDDTRLSVGDAGDPAQPSGVAHFPGTGRRAAAPGPADDKAGVVLASLDQSADRSRRVGLADDRGFARTRPAARKSWNCCGRYCCSRSRCAASRSSGSPGDGETRACSARGGGVSGAGVVRPAAGLAAVPDPGHRGRVVPAGDRRDAGRPVRVAQCRGAGYPRPVAGRNARKSPRSAPSRIAACRLWWWSRPRSP